MRYKCPDCNSSRGYQEFDDGTYCHACHKLTKVKNMFEKPKKEQKILELPEKDSEHKDFIIKAAPYLMRHHVTSEDIARCNIFWSEKYERICFPYYEVTNCGNTRMLFCWMRSLDTSKKDKWVFVGQKNVKMYYFPTWQSSQSHELCIVEDQISAVRISGQMDCVSLGGTNINNPLLLPLLLQYDKIICWLDGDEPGQKATERFLKKYKIYRDIRVIKTERDPKTYTNEQIRGILNDH